jgi:hypothetical protein
LPPLSRTSCAHLRRPGVPPPGLDLNSRRSRPQPKPASTTCPVTAAVGHERRERPVQVARRRSGSRRRTSRLNSRGPRVRSALPPISDTAASRGGAPVHDHRVMGREAPSVSASCMRSEQSGRGGTWGRRRAGAVCPTRSAPVDRSTRSARRKSDLASVGIWRSAPSNREDASAKHGSRDISMKGSDSRTRRSSAMPGSIELSRHSAAGRCISSRPRRAVPFPRPHRSATDRPSRDCRFG